MELFVVVNRATREVVSRHTNKVLAKSERNNLCGKEFFEALAKDSTQLWPFTVSKGSDHYLVKGS